MTIRPVWNGTQSDFRACWRAMFLTDIVYKIAAFVVLAPVVSLTFRLLVAASGRTVLADEDILYFFLGPVGWISALSVGALSLGIFALEQAALMGVIASGARRQPMGVLGAIDFARVHALAVIQTAARMIARVLITSVPFAVIAGLTYVSLLTNYDINYYLNERPPAFLFAVAIGGVLAVMLGAIVLFQCSGWLFALPLILFERRRSVESLRISCDRVRGRRRYVALWILAWAGVTFAISAFLTGMVAVVGQWIVPQSVNSMGLLVVTVGGMLIITTAVNLVTNLFSTAALATLVWNLYLEFGGRDLRESLDDPPSDCEPRAAWRVGQHLTRPRLAAALVAGSLIAGAIGWFTIDSLRLEDHTEIMAHRGASAAAPENTLAAIERAISDRSDWVEIDVQETSDGHVVVFHDSDFKKVAGNDLKTWDATLADLETLDIGSWFAPEFKDERVPTLDRVLENCKGRIRVNIELKYYGHDQQLEQRVAELVDAHGMESQIVIMSLKADAVRKMKALRPQWSVGLLTAAVVGDLTRMDADFLAVGANLADGSFIRAAHKRDKQVYVWTVNDAVTMSTMIGRGVDKLITDKPDLARRVLEARARMNTPERLLVGLATVFGVEPEIGEQ